MEYLIGFKSGNKPIAIWLNMDSERRLQDRIRELEKENSELKEKTAKLEDGFLKAIELLVKKR